MQKEGKGKKRGSVYSLSLGHYTKEASSAPWGYKWGNPFCKAEVQGYKVQTMREAKNKKTKNKKRSTTSQFCLYPNMKIIRHS